MKNLINWWGANGGILGMIFNQTGKLRKIILFLPTVFVFIFFGEKDPFNLWKEQE